MPARCSIVRKTATIAPPAVNMTARATPACRSAPNRPWPDGAAHHRVRALATPMASTTAATRWIAVQGRRAENVASHAVAKTALARAAPCRTRGAASQTGARMTAAKMAALNGAIHSTSRLAETKPSTTNRRQPTSIV